MNRILLAGLCFTALVGARADVIEFQDGTKTECRVLGLLNQRLEYANKDGSITHVGFQQVTHIDFDGKTAMLTTGGRVTLNGQLLLFDDGKFTLTTTNGLMFVAASDVTDFTVSDQHQAPPRPRRPHLATYKAPDSHFIEKDTINPDLGKITVVLFYADRSGPCRFLQSCLEKLAETNSDVVIQKVNIYKQPDLVRQYRVGAVPQVIVYDGKCARVATLIGDDESRILSAVQRARNS